MSTRRPVKYLDVDEELKLRTLHARGLLDSEIGKELGRIRQVIGLIRKRLGLPANKRTRAHYLKAYRKSVRTKGNMGERRWRESNYDAFLEGAPTGITPTQWKVLKKIHEGVNMSLDLVEALSMSKDSVNRVVSDLRIMNLISPIERKGRKGYVWKVNIKINTALSSQSQTSLEDTNLESSVTDLEHGTPVMSS